MNGNEIDASNEFMVGVGDGGKTVSILRLNAHMSREAALNLAAWIVAMTDYSPDNVTFMTLLERVEAAG